MTRELLFDPVQLVRRAEAMTRSTPVADLPDLLDRLAKPEGSVTWTIVGDPSVEGRMQFKLHLKANLELMCQRCLGELPWAVDETRTFVLYTDEDSMPSLEDEPDDVESLWVQGPVNALDLVSEELLLALPMMALHDSETCHATAEAQTPVKANPFAVLKGLKN